MSEPSRPAEPTSAALVVCSPPRRPQVSAWAEAAGLTPVEAADPYVAMAELSRSPDDVSAVILSLQGTYREELQIIASIRRRFPEIDVWLTDIDGRSGMFAEAIRLGADGLLGEDGLHRMSERATQPTAIVDPVSSPAVRIVETGTNGHASVEPVASVAAEPVAERVRPALGSSGRETSRRPAPEPAAVVAASAAAEPTVVKDEDPYAFSPGEPILTAEELRALLHDPDTPGA